jgi:proteic killer suppression protein
VYLSGLSRPRQVVYFFRNVIGAPVVDKEVSTIQLTPRPDRPSMKRVVASFRDKATLPEEMNVTGYRFHSLRGNSQRWSVRVTANYRITFGWSGENALDVDFEDYH